jgi:hypothetical protein
LAFLTSFLASFTTPIDPLRTSPVTPSFLIPIFLFFYFLLTKASPKISP